MGFQPSKEQKIAGMTWGISELLITIPILRYSRGLTAEQLDRGIKDANSIGRLGKER